MQASEIKVGQKIVILNKKTKRREFAGIVLDKTNHNITVQNPKGEVRIIATLKFIILIMPLVDRIIDFFLRQKSKFL